MSVNKMSLIVVFMVTVLNPVLSQGRSHFTANRSGLPSGLTTSRRRSRVLSASIRAHRPTTQQFPPYNRVPSHNPFIPTHRASNAQQPIHHEVNVIRQTVLVTRNRNIIPQSRTHGAGGQLGAGGLHGVGGQHGVGGRHGAGARAGARTGAGAVGGSGGRRGIFSRFHRLPANDIRGGVGHRGGATTRRQMVGRLNGAAGAGGVVGAGAGHSTGANTNNQASRIVIMPRQGHTQPIVVHARGNLNVATHMDADGTSRIVISPKKLTGQGQGQGQGWSQAAAAEGGKSGIQYQTTTPEEVEA